MSAEQNIAYERRIISEMNKGNWGIVDESFSADFIYHGPFGGLNKMYPWRRLSALFEYLAVADVGGNASRL
jgi:hypothetical protein